MVKRISVIFVNCATYAAHPLNHMHISVVCLTMLSWFKFHNLRGFRFGLKHSVAALLLI